MSNKNIYLWSTTNRIGTQLISFIGNVLIARQISPDDYGLVAMLAIFMGIAWNFTESGFADCLIRRVNADKKDFGTVMTFNITIGILMFIIFYLSAPFIADFFGRNELVNIARILGLSIIIRAISITEFTRLRKELQFKTLAIIRICANSLAVIIAYILALNGFGYWALVSQALCIGIADILLIILLANWKPYLYFSKRRFKEMSGFSFNLLLSYFSYQIGNNLYSLFIGKFQSALMLGFYRQAQKLKDAPIVGLNAIILTTTYPLLAKITDEKKRFDKYENLLNKFLFIQFLMCSFLIGSAEPLIEILFGEKWINTIPYFQLMIVAYLFYPLTTLNYNIAKIYGRSKIYRNLTFLKNGLALVMLLLTMRQNIHIILYGQILALYVSVIVDITICGSIIDFGFFKQLKITMKQIWAPSVSLIAGYLIVQNIDNIWLRFGSFTLIFLVVFILLNEYFKQESYSQIKYSVQQNIKRVLKT